jgi:putative heme-binding domain-containing protein
LLSLCTGLALWAQEQHGSIQLNPFSSLEDAAEGGKYFRSTCAACHGGDAAGGGNAPSLVTGTFKHGGSDEALYNTITKGVPGTPMTAYKLNGRDVWQLIAFIRSVNIAKAAGQAPGDAAKGAALYNANGCSRCHTVGLNGGFSGPDLSNIGSLRSLPQLETALTDPSADVAPDFWTVRAKTKAGQDVTGMRLNEDMDTIQIRDPQNRLRTLQRSDLASSQIVRTSPMPSFKDKLSADDVKNLISYLASLRTPAGAEEQKK